MFEPVIDTVLSYWVCNIISNFFDLWYRISNYYSVAGRMHHFDVIEIVAKADNRFFVSPSLSIRVFRPVPLFTS